jgi:hypothetical protein
MVSSMRALTTHEVDPMIDIRSSSVAYCERGRDRDRQATLRSRQVAARRCDSIEAHESTNRYLHRPPRTAAQSTRTCAPRRRKLLALSPLVVIAYTHMKSIEITIIASEATIAIAFNRARMHAHDAFRCTVRVDSGIHRNPTMDAWWRRRRRGVMESQLSCV